MCQVTTTMWLLPKTFWRLTNIDIYIYKISRWSYSILSKVFIWIQSSKINGSRMQRFVTIGSCLALTDFYHNFDAHIPVNKHFSYDLHKKPTPSPSQEKASVPISWFILLFFRIWLPIPQKWPNGFSYIWSELSHWNTIIQ